MEEETKASPPKKTAAKPASSRTRQMSKSLDSENVIEQELTGPNSKVFMQGRPPWYTVPGKQQKEALVIGLCGGSASGKTTVAHRIIKALGVSWVCLLSMDSFYKVLDEEESKRAHNNEFNFDIPNAFDIDLLVETLKKLKQFNSVRVPIYDFKTHNRKKETVTMYGANVIIFEGILSFCTKELRDLMDLKVFVSEDDDIRFARRVLRDTRSRGRDVEGAIKQYRTFVQPAYKEFIHPLSTYADITLPGGISNVVGMDMIVDFVRAGLKDRGINITQDIIGVDVVQLPDSFKLMEQSKQVMSLMTVLRDSRSPNGEFHRAADRVLTLLMEHALQFAKYEPVEVEMLDGSTYQGTKMGPIVGATAVRAGIPLQRILRHIVPDVPIGQMLIQTNAETKQPEFFFRYLPDNLENKTIFILDSIVSTGQAAIMAVRVLLDHGATDENIVFVALTGSRMGICSLAYVYPKITIVSAACEEGIDDECHLLPGIGSFGDRYFGTDTTKGSSPK